MSPRLPKGSSLRDAVLRGGISRNGARERERKRERAREERIGEERRDQRDWRGAAREKEKEALDGEKRPMGGVAMWW